MGKILREIARPFDRLLFRPCLRRLRGGAFCVVFNIRNFLFCRIRGIKLRYDAEDRIFYAMNSATRVAMFSPVQILDMYSRGLQKTLFFDLSPTHRYPSSPQKTLFQY